MMDGELGRDRSRSCRNNFDSLGHQLQNQFSTKGDHLLTAMPRPELSQEQVSLLSSQEYEHLQATYSSLVKSINLAPNNQLSLKTLEDVSYTIVVTSEGWKVLQGGQQRDRERTWEMPEDLLRSVSDRFKQGWDLMLLAKLNVLADAQESSPPED